MKFNLKKFKEVIKIENILCLYIIICPILDILSFVFRNKFNTTMSPSTILRPIIPIIVILYLFLKEKKKFKLSIVIISIVYLIYAIIHIYIFKKIKTGSSYSNELHELQYIVNYTFMILNLFLYTYIYKNRETDKLKKSVLFASFIYITSIYLSIITKTSSNTYPLEKMGYKGWFESGNSLSAILLLTLFIYINYLKNEKYKKTVIILIALVGFFLTFLIGTRVGLLGYTLILSIYIIIEVFYSLLHNTFSTNFQSF